MKKALLILVASGVVSITPPAFATSPGEDDRADIDAAYEAIRTKDPETAILKTDSIIKHFEAGKQDDSIYSCTSGFSDTVSAMLEAAVKADKGEMETGKTMTIAVSENICSAYFLKGFALIDQGNRDEALPNLQLAVEMDTDNQHYLNELAEWYKAGKNWTKSLEMFTKASETTDLSIALMKDKEQSTKILNATLCRSYRGIAFNHAEMRNWDEARSAATKCLELIPNDARSIGELQYINKQSGEQ